MESDKILKLLEFKQKELIKLINTNQTQVLKKIDESAQQIEDINEINSLRKECDALKVKLEEILKIVSAPFAFSGLSPVDVLKLKGIITRKDAA